MEILKVIPYNIINIINHCKIEYNLHCKNSSKYKFHIKHINISKINKKS